MDYPHTPSDRTCRFCFQTLNDTLIQQFETEKRLTVWRQTFLETPRISHLALTLPFLTKSYFITLGNALKNNVVSRAEVKKMLSTPLPEEKGKQSTFDILLRGALDPHNENQQTCIDNLLVLGENFKIVPDFTGKQVDQIIRQQHISLMNLISKNKLHAAVQTHLFEADPLLPDNINDHQTYLGFWLNRIIQKPSQAKMFNRALQLPQNRWFIHQACTFKTPEEQQETLEKFGLDILFFGQHRTKTRTGKRTYQTYLNTFNTLLSYHPLINTKTLYEEAFKKQDANVIGALLKNDYQIPDEKMTDYYDYSNKSVQKIVLNYAFKDEPFFTKHIAKWCLKSPIIRGSFWVANQLINQCRQNQR